MAKKAKEIEIHLKALKEYRIIHKASIKMIVKLRNCHKLRKLWMYLFVVFRLYLGHFGHLQFSQPCF